jgi:glycosyltransferase involved in cell wall biosynthesis
MGANCGTSLRQLRISLDSHRPLEKVSLVSNGPYGDNGMRIAEIAPLYESVPPKLYGGTERVVSYLTEELVELGHEVTLFASGDSVTAARLIPACPNSLRLDKRCIDQLAHHYVMLEEVMERAAEFDIIHFHVDYLHFPISRILGFPHVTTLHGRLDLPDLVPLYRKYRHMPVVSISRGQRKPLGWANWVGNVYHGLPAARLSLGDGGGRYLAFLGRICPEKRPDRAIQIALQVGMPLKIAAKVDRADREYYECKIKPLLANPNIEYIGEIAEHQKADFLGNAYAHLFPIDWPEPFGLTMIEAMACGTPTIAFNCGSVPEVITQGVTGLIVNNVEEAVDAVAEVSTLNRAACRQEFETQFTASRMARDYVNLYEAVLNAKSLSSETPEVDSCLSL